MGGATVQVGANYGCGRPLRRIPHQVTGASNLIENLLSNCKRFFYLECQYGIGNVPLANSIKRAFANGAAFGIVVLAAREVVSDFPEVAFRRYQFWRSFPQVDRNLLVFERLVDSGGTAGPHAYVHSKLALVDDQAVSVGSLNLSRRSWRHDSEITAVITDAPELVRGFRLNLWPYHLTLGRGDDIVNPAAAFTIWQAVHAGRPMPRLRPVRMRGTTPPWLSDLLLLANPFQVPAPIMALAKGKIDTLLDRLQDEVFDPVGPPTCLTAAMASRPSVVPIRMG